MVTIEFLTGYIEFYQSSTHFLGNTDFVSSNSITVFFLTLATVAEIFEPLTTPTACWTLFILRC